MKKDAKYIKEKFSNRKTLFKGEAIVLLKLARQVGKEKIKKKIWEDLFTLLNNLNISVYKTPLFKETTKYVDYMRKEIIKLTKKKIYRLD
jgi:hypothetical protein